MLLRSIAGLVELRSVLTDATPTDFARPGVMDALDDFALLLTRFEMSEETY